MKKKNGTGLDDLLLASVQAAKLILVSLTTLYEREREGWIRRTGPDQWRAVDVVHGNCRYLADRAKRASQTGMLTRMQEAKARALERKNLVAEGKLCDVDEMLQETTELIGPLMARLGGLPAECTRDLGMRAVIQQKVDATLRD